MIRVKILITRFIESINTAYMNKLLIADDDIELCQLLQDYLTEEGFYIDIVHDGKTAIEKISMVKYDLLLLDVMMPIQNGFETLTLLRQSSYIPVIMLTAKGEKIDRIVGLEMGADDYVTKPCDPRELTARIRAVLRRFTQAGLETAKNQSEMIDINNVSVDLLNREVKVNSQTIELTPTEFDLLNTLISNAGKLVSKQLLSENCLGKKLQPFDRSIDMHLSNIRKKLGNFAPEKPRIKTVRGNGYQYLIWPES